MQTSTPPYAFAAIALVAASMLAGCGKSGPPATPASTDQTAQTAVPAPPGDSTPKPAEEQAKASSGGTDAASRSGGGQSTVGTAASGAPPYTLQGAPEGNPAPKGGDAPKK